MESGNPGSVSPNSNASSRDNDSLGQATKCVRKFAPKSSSLNPAYRHITACKISNAQPNEMIVSWSCDNIYSFDLIKSPDAADTEPRPNRSRLKKGVNGKSRESGDRKRKRRNENLSASVGGEEPSIKSRSASNLREHPEMSLPAHDENGHGEDSFVGHHVMSTSRSSMEAVTEPALNDHPNEILRIAQNVAKIQKLMFFFDPPSRELLATGRSDYSAYTNTFTSILGLAATYITEMDRVIRSWTYPINPCQDEVTFQQALRRKRNFSRRFVQATGTLARVLGGKLQTVDRGPSPVLHIFDQIGPAPEADWHASQTQNFSLEFLRAILLWLQGGTTALLQGFKRPENRRPGNPTFPVPDEAYSDGIDDHVIPYLLQLAQDHPVINIDASRFELDEHRKIFENETAAVTAFSRAIKIPLEELPEGIIPVPPDNGERRSHLTREQEALNYWGFKIGRSLLMRAGEGITFQTVDEAFGGLGRAQPDESRLQEDIDPNEMEDVVESSDYLRPFPVENERALPPISPYVGEHEVSGSMISHEPRVGLNQSDFEIDGDTPLPEDRHEDLDEQAAEDEHDYYHEDEDADEDTDQDASEDEDEDEDEDKDEDTDEDEDEADEEDEESSGLREYRPRFITSAAYRRNHGMKAERNVPCSSHHRSYRGHCNVRTVKDVNYFGLQDEYVVSGSDSGHVFIWDKKTSELVNILEGDEEVVNVVQGKLLRSGLIPFSIGMASLIV